MKTTDLPAWAVPGWEPRLDKSDVPLFDKSAPKSKRVRLFDIELKDNVEARPEPAPYTLEQRRRPRPFLRLAERTRAFAFAIADGDNVYAVARAGAPDVPVTGEVVMRKRGGKGYLPIYPRWRPDGLVERGVDYPHGHAAADPGHGPYVLKRAAELALGGADISGCNVPRAVEFASRTLDANVRANRGLESIGPRIGEDEELSEPTVAPDWLPQWAKPTWTIKTARQVYRLELEERKQLGWERVWVPGMPLHVDRGRRAKTTEYRNAAGEYGPETKLTRDGRVVFGKGGQPWLDRPVVTRLRGLSDPDGPVKPGPKPIYGFAMNHKIRKAKSRCKKKGVPFVLENYLKMKERT